MIYAAGSPSTRLACAFFGASRCLCYGSNCSVVVKGSRLQTITVKYLPDKVCCVAFHSHGGQIAACTESGVYLLWPYTVDSKSIPALSNSFNITLSWEVVGQYSMGPARTQSTVESDKHRHPIDVGFLDRNILVLMSDGSLMSYNWTDKLDATSSTSILADPGIPELHKTNTMKGDSLANNKTVVLFPSPPPLLLCDESMMSKQNDTLKYVKSNIKDSGYPFSSFSRIDCAQDGVHAALWSEKSSNVLVVELMPSVRCVPPNVEDNVLLLAVCSMLTHDSNVRHIKWKHGNCAGMHGHVVCACHSLLATLDSHSIIRVHAWADRRTRLGPLTIVGDATELSPSQRSRYRDIVGVSADVYRCRDVIVKSYVVACLLALPQKHNLVLSVAQYKENSDIIISDNDDINVEITKIDWMFRTDAHTNLRPLCNTFGDWVCATCHVTVNMDISMDDSGVYAEMSKKPSLSYDRKGYAFTMLLTWYVETSMSIQPLVCARSMEMAASLGQFLSESGSDLFKQTSSKTSPEEVPREEEGDGDWSPDMLLLLNRILTNRVASPRDRKLILGYASGLSVPVTYKPGAYIHKQPLDAQVIQGGSSPTATAFMSGCCVVSRKDFYYGMANMGSIGESLNMTSTNSTALSQYSGPETLFLDDWTYQTERTKIKTVLDFMLFGVQDLDNGVVVSRAMVWLPPVSGSLIVFYDDDTAAAKSLTMPTLENILEHIIKVKNSSDENNWALLGELDAVPPLGLLSSSKFMKNSASGYNHLDGFKNTSLVVELPSVKMELVVRTSGHKSPLIKVSTHPCLSIVASLDSDGCIWMWELGGIAPRTHPVAISEQELSNFIGFNAPKYDASGVNHTFRAHLGHTVMTPLMSVKPGGGCKTTSDDAYIQSTYRKHDVVHVRNGGGGDDDVQSMMLMMVKGGNSHSLYAMLINVGNNGENSQSSSICVSPLSWLSRPALVPANTEHNYFAPLPKVSDQWAVVPHLPDSTCDLEYSWVDIRATNEAVSKKVLGRMWTVFAVSNGGKFLRVWAATLADVNIDEQVQPISGSNVSALGDLVVENKFDNPITAAAVVPAPDVCSRTLSICVEPGCVSFGSRVSSCVVTDHVLITGHEDGTCMIWQVRLHRVAAVTDEDETSDFVTPLGIVHHAELFCIGKWSTGNAAIASISASRTFHIVADSPDLYIWRGRYMFEAIDDPNSFVVTMSEVGRVGCTSVVLGGNHTPTNQSEVFFDKNYMAVSQCPVLSSDMSVSGTSWDEGDPDGMTVLCCWSLTKSGPHRLQPFRIPVSDAAGPFRRILANQVVECGDGSSVELEISWEGPHAESSWTNVHAKTTKEVFAFAADDTLLTCSDTSLSNEPIRGVFGQRNSDGIDIPLYPLSSVSRRAYHPHVLMGFAKAGRYDLARRMLHHLLYYLVCACISCKAPAEPVVVVEKSRGPRWADDDVEALVRRIGTDDDETPLSYDRASTVRKQDVIIEWNQDVGIDGPWITEPRLYLGRDMTRGTRIAIPPSNLYCHEPVPWTKDHADLLVELLTVCEIDGLRPNEQLEVCRMCSAFVDGTPIIVPSSEGMRTGSKTGFMLSVLVLRRIGNSCEVSDLDESAEIIDTDFGHPVGVSARIQTELNKINSRLLPHVFLDHKPDHSSLYECYCSRIVSRDVLYSARSRESVLVSKAYRDSWRHPAASYAALMEMHADEDTQDTMFKDFKNSIDLINISRGDDPTTRSTYDKAVVARLEDVFYNSRLAFWCKKFSMLKDAIDRLSAKVYAATRDPEECLLWLVLLNKRNTLLTMLKTATGKKKLLDLLSQDLTDPRWLTALMKNAYALRSKHRYEMAVAFFIMAGALNDAISVCLRDMNNIQLAVLVCRLCDSKSWGHASHVNIDDHGAFYLDPECRDKAIHLIYLPHLIIPSIITFDTASLLLGLVFSKNFDLAHVCFGCHDDVIGLMTVVESPLASVVEEYIKNDKRIMSLHTLLSEGVIDASIGRCANFVAKQLIRAMCSVSVLLARHPELSLMLDLLATMSPSKDEPDGRRIMSHSLQSFVSHRLLVRRGRHVLAALTIGECMRSFNAAARLMLFPVQATTKSSVTAKKQEGVSSDYHDYTSYVMFSDDESDDDEQQQASVSVTPQQLMALRFGRRYLEGVFLSFSAQFVLRRLHSRLAGPGVGSYGASDIGYEDKMWQADKVINDETACQAAGVIPFHLHYNIIRKTNDGRCTVVPVKASSFPVMFDQLATDLDCLADVVYQEQISDQSGGGPGEWKASKLQLEISDRLTLTAERAQVPAIRCLMLMYERIRKARKVMREVDSDISNLVDRWSRLTTTQPLDISEAKDIVKRAACVLYGSEPAKLVECWVTESIGLLGLPVMYALGSRTSEAWIRIIGQVIWIADGDYLFGSLMEMMIAEILDAVTASPSKNEIISCVHGAAATCFAEKMTRNSLAEPMRLRSLTVMRSHISSLKKNLSQLYTMAQSKSNEGGTLLTFAVSSFEPSLMFIPLDESILATLFTYALTHPARCHHILFELLAYVAKVKQQHSEQTRRRRSSKVSVDSDTSDDDSDSDSTSNFGLLFNEGFKPGTDDPAVLQVFARHSIRWRAATLREVFELLWRMAGAEEAVGLSKLLFSDPMSSSCSSTSPPLTQTVVQPVGDDIEIPMTGVNTHRTLLKSIPKALTRLLYSYALFSTIVPSYSWKDLLMPTIDSAVDGKEPNKSHIKNILKGTEGFGGDLGSALGAWMSIPLVDGADMDEHRRIQNVLALFELAFYHHQYESSVASRVVLHLVALQSDVMMMVSALTRDSSKYHPQDIPHMLQPPPDAVSVFWLPISNLNDLLTINDDNGNVTPGSQIPKWQYLDIWRTVCEWGGVLAIRPLVEATVRMIWNEVRTTVPLQLRLQQTSPHLVFSQTNPRTKNDSARPSRIAILTSEGNIQLSLPSAFQRLSRISSQMALSAQSGDDTNYLSGMMALPPLVSRAGRKSGLPGILNAFTSRFRRATPTSSGNLLTIPQMHDIHMHPLSPENPFVTSEMLRNRPASPIQSPPALIVRNRLRLTVTGSPMIPRSFSYVDQRRDSVTSSEVTEVRPRRNAKIYSPTYQPELHRGSYVDTEHNTSTGTTVASIPRVSSFASEMTPRSSRPTSPQPPRVAAALHDLGLFTANSILAAHRSLPVFAAAGTSGTIGLWDFVKKSDELPPAILPSSQIPIANIALPKINGVPVTKPTGLRWDHKGDRLVACDLTGRISLIEVAQPLLIDLILQSRELAAASSISSSASNILAPTLGATVHKGPLYDVDFIYPSSNVVVAVGAQTYNTLEQGMFSNYPGRPRSGANNKYGIFVYDFLMPPSISCQLKLMGHEGGTSCVCAIPGTMLVATGGMDGSIALYDLRMPISRVSSVEPMTVSLPSLEPPIVHYGLYPGLGYAARYIPSGVDLDRLLESETLKKCVKNAHTLEVTSMTVGSWWTGSNDTLVTGSADGSIRIWNIRNGLSCLQTWPAPHSQVLRSRNVSKVQSVTVANDGALYSLGSNGTVLCFPFIM